MIKKFLRKNFFKIFQILKILNYFFFKKSINNTHFYINDLKLMSKELKISDENAVIFDVGAHKGNEAQYIKEYYPKAKIFCFEAVPEVFKKLDKRFNSIKNIRCHNLFINDFDINKNITMNIDDKTDLVGSYYQKTDVTKTTNLKLVVKSDTLDNFTKKMDIKKIFFLRIDVNGYEKNVLLGAENLLKGKQIDFVQVYFFNVLSKLEGGSLTEISKLLNKYDYRIMTFYNNFFHKKAFGGYYSVIFVRSNF